MRPITDLIIHCTATRPDWWQSRTAKQKVSEVRKWHVEDRGWSDIGYHFLIDRDGMVVEGRALERTGAHTKGHNKCSIGICLFGGHGGSENDPFSDHFTPEQEKALRSLINKLQDRFGMLKVSGHNQYAAKACPCFKVPGWYHNTPPRTSPTQSKTMRAGMGQIATGISGAATSIGYLEGTTQIVAIIAFTAVILMALYIMRERLRKWAGGVL